MSDLRPAPLVIGTAGHIDHGKSALIEALTGDHPDRWREEKERGITMDLGYAEMAFADGLEIGFVDVPGHERLVRKMVAGATGMGAAMMAIACDDGVMPQTREHFEVLQLLGISRGILVLTKADLADEDTLELVRGEVVELVQGTPWQDVQILSVSAHTGAGLPELKLSLRELAESHPNTGQGRSLFRMPVQRSFAMHGAGTIATGVCASGQVVAGDTLVAMPAGKSSRVRRVQVHGRDSETGSAGLRTALNLPDLNPQHCVRGTVLAAPDSLEAGALLRVHLQWLPDAPQIQHGAQVQILSGTSSVDGRVFLPPALAQKGHLGAYPDGLVDIELAEPIALAPRDRLILRRPSPAVNLGLGHFLAFGSYRLKKRDAEERQQLERLAEHLADPDCFLIALLETYGATPTSTQALACRMGWHHEATSSALMQACAQGQARQVGEDRFLGMSGSGAFAQQVASILGGWRRDCSHRLLIPITHLRDALGKEGYRSLKKAPDEELASYGLERMPGTHWRLRGVTLGVALLARAQAIHEVLERAQFQPPSFDVLAESFGALSEVEICIDVLLDQGCVVRPEQGFVLAVSCAEALRNRVVEQLQGSGMDIPALRDEFQTSRKFLMPLLEWLDDRGVTMRRAGNRVLRDATASLT